MKIDINRVSILANLPITDKEKKNLAKQLDETLKHIDRLKEIDTSNVQGTNEVTNLKNVWREDEVRKSLSQEQALSNAKKTHNGFFVVPVILEEAIK